MSTDDFHHRHRHDVRPAEDYHFASEFYPDDDWRAPVTSEFMSRAAKSLGARPYNCKISCVKPAATFYNVDLYFQDLVASFGAEGRRWFLAGDKRLRDIFLNVVSLLDPPPLRGLKINSNGVFVHDFRERSQAWSLGRSWKRVEGLLARQYPEVVHHIRWDTHIYLFFANRDSIDRFVREGKPGTFRSDMLGILSDFDHDGVWGDPPGTMLDLHQNYTDIGHRNYFNYDAMASGTWI
ncbi:MAG: hypothetical protein FWF02_09165 [Micrococcales bacterium]|nr:hypothetical protein [Micrococcales bacterium]MCL2667859.1 hypothetical protein [Micrococcales bacterium]